MNKEFVCTIDGRSFLDKTQALEYLASRYLTEVEKVEGLEDYEKKLKESFPNYIFKLTKSEITDEDRQHSYQYQEGDREEIFVSMESTKIEAKFHFTIIERKVEDWSYPHGYDGDRDSFPSLDTAINFYGLLINSADIFCTKLLNEVKKYRNDIINIVISQIHQSCGTADDFNQYHTKMVLSDGNIKDYGYFEFDKYDLESSDTLHKEIDKWLEGIKGSYVTKIEGEVTKGYAKYCNDHSQWYVIDGVALDTLASRAKRMRVEILEFNDNA